MTPDKDAVSITLRQANIEKWEDIRDTILSNHWVLSLPAKWSQAGERARDHRKALKTLENNLRAAQKNTEWLCRLNTTTPHRDPELSTAEPYLKLAQILKELIDQCKQELESASGNACRPKMLGNLHVGLWLYGHLEKIGVAEHRRCSLVGSLLQDLGIDEEEARGTVRAIRTFVKERKVKELGSKE